MRRDPSSSQRRYLAIWFPFLPSDRLAREAMRAGEALPDAPIVLVNKVGGAVRLTAANASALEMGLTPGMTLADARARTPDIMTAPDMPEADVALMRHVLGDFTRFTPMAAPDGPDALIMDVTGCSHLFAGEAGLLRAVDGRARRIGLNVRLALAGTPQAARALSRFGLGGLTPPGGDRTRVRPLPVEAMELPDRETQALRRAGLKTIADLDERPRSPLAARFGPDFPTRLDRLLGLEDPRITPHRPPAALSEDQPLTFFAGIWTPNWTCVRKVKTGVETCDVFAFLTTEPNAEVGAVHPKAMPVILTTVEEREVWMSAPWEEAKRLQKPLADGSLLRLVSLA